VEVEMDAGAGGGRLSWRCQDGGVILFLPSCIDVDKKGFSGSEGVVGGGSCGLCRSGAVASLPLEVALVCVATEVLLEVAEVDWRTLAVRY